VTTGDIGDRINNVLVARLPVDAVNIAEVSNLEADLGATQSRHGRNDNVAGGRVWH
jgi:hypothetical protein